MNQEQPTPQPESVEDAAEKPRFSIAEVGRMPLVFESEARISDSLDECKTIIVKSGYTDIESTGVYAQEIVDLLNKNYEKVISKRHFKTGRNT